MGKLARSVIIVFSAARPVDTHTHTHMLKGAQQSIYVLLFSDARDVKILGVVYNIIETTVYILRSILETPAVNRLVQTFHG